MLPIAVDAVNDSPRIVVPHHRLLKFGDFEVLGGLSTTRLLPATTEGNLTISISTDTAPGRVMLRGTGSSKITEVEVFRSRVKIFCQYSVVASFIVRPGLHG